MKTGLWKSLLLVVFSCACLCFPAALKRCTAGFKLAKMRLILESRPEWDVEPILRREELFAIFQEPYTFLGKGSQCYVFASRDGRYVCKLFRYDQPQWFWHKKLFTVSQRKNKVPSQKKAEQLFFACLLAYHLAREETALLYLHLNLTEGQLPKLTLRLPMGQRLELPLDRYRFAIQRRVQPMQEVLNEALSDSRRLQARIDALAVLLDARLGKGIGNRDPSLMRNFGYLGEKAIEIDFGSYHLHPREKEKEHYLQQLHRWLAQQYKSSVE